MEYFDIRKKDGTVTGQMKERTKVHADGDLHGTAHVFIVQKRKNGGLDLLLQKRSENKDAYPGCYDISSAGHLPAGQDYLESAIRELEEELGIKAEKEQLIFLGWHEGISEAMFYGRPFRNHEISKVYLYQEPVDLVALVLQKEEVQSVKWMEFSNCYEEVRRGNPEYCLFLEELDMIWNFYQKEMCGDE